MVRLLASLAKDRRVSRAVRWRLLVALVYNAQPINIIPDFVPVIGLADNVVGNGLGGAQRHPQVGASGDAEQLERQPRWLHSAVPALPTQRRR